MMVLEITSEKSLSHVQEMVEDLSDQEWYGKIKWQSSAPCLFPKKWEGH